MGGKTATEMAPATYFELVKQFPLSHIRNGAHLESAHQVIDRLLQEDLDGGAQDYLDVLTDQVEAYEEEHVAIPDASGADVLRELMRANGLSQAKLTKEVRIAQSTLSALLNGGRSFTTDHVVALGRFFHVSPAVFLRA